MPAQGYSFVTALILGIWGGLTMLSISGTSWNLQDPIVTGFVTGIVVHNIPVGLAVGAVLELMSLGLWTYGGAIVPDYMSGALIGTAVAALSHGTMDQCVTEGVTVAIPVSILMSQLDLLLYSSAVVYIHAADRCCDSENERGMTVMHWASFIPQFFSRCIPIMLAIGLGVQPLRTVLAATPGWLTRGLDAMRMFLPAVGFGILLTYLPFRKWWSFFLLGFVFFAYLHVPLIGEAVLALAFASTYSLLARRTEGVSRAEVPAAKAAGRMTRRAFMQTVWRHNMAFEMSWNYERMQALGFAWCMMPVLRSIYADDRHAYFASIKRHLQFFNSNSIIGSPMIMGAVCALEERGETALADSLKCSLMGPLAGIGDTIVAVLMKPVIAIFAASLALAGHASGAILMVLLGLCWFCFRFVGFNVGYRQGKDLVREVNRGFLDAVTEAASQAGLFIAGGFLPGLLGTITTPLQFVHRVVVQGAPVTETIRLQEILDKIVPYALPLLLVFFVYWLIKKEHWSDLNVLLVVMVLGIACGVLRLI